MSKENFKKKLSSLLHVPEEVILDVPKITIVNNDNVLIENYKGVVEYENYKIRIKVNGGVVVIEGKNMVIDEIVPDDVIIRGEIKCLSLNYGII